MPDHAKDRTAAIAWARRMLDAKAVILDSETTGLGHDAQIVQLAVVSHQGVTLFDTLIRPTCLIPPDATAIHGIDDDQVADAPTFKEVYPELWRVLRDRPLVIYNADFDTRILSQCAALDQLAVPFDWKAVSCCMLKYAAFVGYWNDYRRSYRWQKLEGGDHSALGDCRATLKLMRLMAGAT